MCVNVARLGLGNEDCCGGGDGAGVGGGMMGMYSVVGGGEEAMIAFSQRVEGLCESTVGVARSNTAELFRV